jgi:hypothetical protein
MTRTLDTVAMTVLRRACLARTARRRTSSALGLWLPSG